ncbi:hypothetical protein FA13DRAFT_1636967 [Coprinellus micaceus]|uniref:DNA replication regulator Sld3 C-terminal domain-containing protein n=1 Tax=Coprinellus micaceus TaxID=71717 RepID=A0A4Y7SV83_COPMI|nr:hypothetical protein FA13DRAFT_1636967 [Coprinellus micaceus]
MATIQSVYSLSSQKKVHWSAVQENSLSEFPFELSEESPEEFAYRTYLQFLWLPESIMPLNLLVPSMRRINAPSSSAAHPLHAPLDDILQTVSSMNTKYRKELLRILVNGGGAGEVEETMMWFAVSHENAETEEPWLDAAWRDQWLERLQRREVEIQIMLYFLKLSLPAPPQTDKGKRKRRRSFSAEVTTEEYLEQFMDRLSMWQLLEAVQSTRGDKVEERDWMQSFCEEIVEPEFRNLLPNLCSLLRSKVFPHSPFSDTESDTSTTRASSPAEESQPASRGISRAPSQAKGFQPDARALARERSRSLSMSLAQEREQTTAAPTKKRMGTREISMSRIFKARSKPTTAATSGKPEHEPQPSQSQSRAKDVGVTLVEDTPAKPRDRTVSFSQTQAMYPSSRNLFTRQDSALSVATDNDDAWQISSSPDIMMLASPGKTDDDGDIDMVHTTPSRPSRAKGRGKGGRK